MSGHYVILNFEDTKDSQGGAAKNTQDVLTKKWEARGDNKVIEYRCITNQQGMPKLVEGDTLSEMRADCLKSEKIYLVMHGDSTDSNNAYANRFDEGEGLLLIGDYKKIATFVLQLLSKRTTSYKVGLIMCFGAKPDKSNVKRIKNKTKPTNSELKTSFAYKLFKMLCQKCSLKMTAVTREIAHNVKDNRSYVTNELLLDHTIEKADAHKKIIKSQGALNVQYGYYMKKDRVETRKKIEQYKGDNKLLAKDNFEQFAKAYAAWETSTEGEVWNTLHMLACERYQDEILNIVCNYEKAESPRLSKYGKYVYTFEKDTLKIINKYAHQIRGLEAGEALYEGPLL